jgi:hypothetical protein
LTSPRLWFWRASPVPDWDTPQKIIVLPFIGDYNKAFTKKHVSEHVQIFKENCTRAEIKDKKGNF